MRLIDERGMSLSEVMVTVVIIGIIVAPLAAWVGPGLRTSYEGHDRSKEAAGQALLTARIESDTRKAYELQTGVPMCAGGPGNSDLLVKLWLPEYNEPPAYVPLSTKAIEYTLGPDDDSVMTLWRRTCTNEVPLVVSSAVPVLRGIEIPPGGVADMVECDAAGTACREVTLIVDTEDGEPFEIRATRRRGVVGG